MSVRLLWTRIERFVRSRLPFAIFLFLVAPWFLVTAPGCGDDSEGTVNDETSPRADHAVLVEIPLEGSLQNPVASPDGSSILVTMWRRRYNEGAADLYVFDVGTGQARALVSDGGANVNLPGSVWDAATGRIVFSSDREPHDEIYVIDAAGATGDEQQVTDRSDRVAYEPSLSPDGTWVVFESHPLDVETHGVITKCLVESPDAYVELTGPEDDCRQPNWSPAGDRIVYQKQTDGQWDLWLTDPDGSFQQQLTSGPGDKTDASFSPNGNWVVYSSSEGDLEFANIFIIPVEGGRSRQVTHYSGYDGAPTWTGQGTILFESCPGDPDNSKGTKIWSIAVPADVTD